MILNYNARELNSLFNTILSKKKIHEVLIISLIVRKEIVQTNCTWIKASQQEEETTRRKALIVISQYFFVYIFIAWKNPRRHSSSNMQDPIHLGLAISWTQSNVGLAICQTQHTWIHESAALKATIWTWWNVKLKTLRFNN